MSNFLNIDKDLNVKEGIDIMQMAKIYEKMAKKDPDAKLNLDDNFIILNNITGEININSNLEKSNKTTIKLDGSNKQILVPNGSIAIVNTNEKSLTIQFSPSGKLILSKENSSELRQKPEYINDIHQKIDDWLWNGETGLSSMAIVQHLFLIPNNLMKKDEEIYYSIPRDDSDYSRCVKMFDAIPELMEKLPNLSKINDNWAKIMEKETNDLSIFENNLLKVKQNIDKFEKKNKSKPKLI